MNEPSITKKLLLIDDDSGAHLLLRRVMEEKPPIEIILLEAMSFESGMKIVLEQKPDICLLDLNFKGVGSSGDMRAPETLQAMRSSGMADLVPTLIITGHMEPSDQWTPGKLWKEARIAGAVGFLRKDRYLDKRNRDFLLHEFADAMLEFTVRQEMKIKFGPPAYDAQPSEPRG